MMLATPPSITHRHLHSGIIPPPGPGHRRRLVSTARAAVKRDGATTEVAGDEGASSSSPPPPPPESSRVTKAAATATPAAFSLPKDYSHTLFHSEFLEVLGLIDLESLRKRPRLTVGVTVKASLPLPVLVVLAALYLADVTSGLVDWTHHHLEGDADDVGD
jgi:hypothetical protein